MPKYRIEEQVIENRRKFNEPIVLRIRELRRKSNIPLEEIANLHGILTTGRPSTGKNYINHESRLLSGIPLDLFEIAKYAEIFKVPISEILSPILEKEKKISS